MNLLKHVCCFLIFALCVISCTKDIVDTTGNIVGTVRDARTQEALKGASVSVVETGATSSTGADGTFIFRDLEAQRYTVKVTKSDYKSDSKTVLVAAGKDNSVDFSLTPSVAVLSVSKLSLDFGTTTTSLTFDIKNTGTSALTWSISEDIAWLSCSPTSGTTPPDEKASVVVNVKRDGLERGNYSQTIAVASNGGSEVVRVDMTVPGASVSISPGELDFGSTITSMQLTLTNNGNGNVSYALSTSNEWIKLNKTSGSFTSKENINVSVDRSGFSAGDYSGSVTVSIDNDDTIIPVRMNIPQQEVPTVSLYSVDNVTYNSATFKGGLVSIGSTKVIKHGFCWSKESEPNLDNSQTSNLGDCSEAKEMVYNATSLESNTTYYVRAYAENSEGISYSNIMKFQTLGTPEKPSVETGSVSNISDVQATVAGNILSLGNVSEITQYGHVWSEKSNPTTSDSKTELGKKTDTGSFNSTLTGLFPNKTYYVRAYATNSIGTAYGDEISFTTKYGDIVVVTEKAIDITYKSAVIPCKISSLGGHSISECGICWGTSEAPTVATNVKKAEAVANSYEISLNNLTENTKYFVRAFAKAEDGTVYYGNEIGFTTNGKDVSFGKDDYGDDDNWNSQDNGSFGKNDYGKDNDWNK